MSSSIGTELNALASNAVQRALFGASNASGASGATAASASFAAQLMKHFDADGDGKLDTSELTAAVSSPSQSGLAGLMLGNTSGGGDTVDAIWQRAQIQSIAQGNGPGDAIMQQMCDSYNARHDGSHSGSSGTGGMFDF